MQPGQLDKLKQLIATSPLLENVERAHWLELLPLMNDKQMTDLEGILHPRSAEGQTVLPHLANVPSRLSAPVSQPPRVVQSPPPAKLPIDITEKELPPGPSVREDHFLTTPSAAPKPATPRPVVVPPPVPRSASAMAKFSHLRGLPPQPVPSPVQPVKPEPLPRLKTEAVATSPEAKKTFQRTSFSTTPASGPMAIADVSRMSDETLHWMGAERLTEVLQGLVRKINYFEVLFALEKSPLFASYIRTGQVMLEENTNLDQSNGPTRQNDSRSGQLLSRDDFEAVADLLRGIQVN